MAEKIICSIAKITWIMTPSSPVSVLTNKKISYESSIKNDDGGGNVKTETVTMVLSTKNCPSSLRENRHWFLLELSLGDGTSKNVGSSDYPCAMDMKETDSQVTLTFSVKTPIL